MQLLAHNFAGETTFLGPSKLLILLLLPFLASKIEWTSSKLAQWKRSGWSGKTSSTSYDMMR